MPHGPTGRPGRTARTDPRARELSFLVEELRRARGRAGIVRLSGEPWIGKTRLARRLAREAARQEWAVVWGRAAGGEGPGRPFHALVDALDDRLAALEPGVLRRLGAARVRRLAEVFPALGAGTVPGPEDLDVYAVSRAVRALLEELAGREGLLLVLDDAHRAGPEVAEFAEHLLRRPPAGAVLTLLVHRGGGPGARRLTALAHGDDAVRDVVLRPLSRAEAETLLPAGLAPLRRELVLRDSAGVPGLLRALSADGGPEDDWDMHSGLELTRGDCPSSALPALAPALDLRVLSPLARRTAAVAAAVGDPFTVELVADAGRLAAGDVLRAVDELYGEGMLRPDTLAGRYRFARPAVRALVQRAAGATFRDTVRERAVPVLRAAGAGGEPLLGALLETAPALTAEDAGLLARQAHATLFVQPARAARMARRAAERPDAPLGVRLLLCQALVLSGRLVEAVGEYARVTAPVPGATQGYGQRWPSAENQVADWAEAAVWRARALRLLGVRRQAWDVLRAVPGEGRAAVPETDAELAALLLESGRAARGAASAVARRLARRVPAEEAGMRGHALALLAAADGGEAVREAELLLAGAGPERSAAHVEAWRWLGEAAATAGDGARSRRCFQYGFDLALRHAQGHLLGRFALGLGQACLDTGDAAAAVIHARFASAEFERLTAHDFTAIAQELAKRADRVAAKDSEGDRIALLSAREREIALLIGPGLTNQQIAVRLNISVKTVETHMARIFRKMGAASRAQVTYLLSAPPE
ncbi:LuxR C-terminal-related transcriptional regulator [Streptomyces sp. NPDC046915]|uniref:helix-turn-helix transcriptional regulator n=1 Tax=Streptomyces sp. NPDC046915 TaxID=3155257 RepID=UPI0033C5159E